MQTADLLRHSWERYEAKRDFWRRRNWFYYTYIEKMVRFHTPLGRRAYELSSPFDIPTEKFDYVIASDLLGYVQDVQEFLSHLEAVLTPDGRLVLTQYNTLWEPLLRVGSLLGLRSPSVEQNWISPSDLANFLELAGFEVLSNGTKLLFPVYIPLVSMFFNTLIANLWPFSKLGLIHYVVARVATRQSIGNPSISIVIPARNEAGTIDRIVNEIPTLGSFTELIFIEGHSTDDTRAKIEQAVRNYTGDKRLLFAVQEGKGKGDAVRKGFAMASGEILAIYDADMTVPPSDMEKFYTALTTGRADFANGSRLVYPVERGAMRLANIFGNYFFSRALSAILGQRIKDTLCGTKVLWKSDYELIAKNRAFFGDFDPFGDFDLIFGAAKMHLKILDIPIRYKDRVYGSTNINRWRHGLLLLQMTLFAARKLRFW